MARKRAALGSVAIVGAGPGDPGLITVRGLAALRSADVVLCDRLARSVVTLARPDAEVIDVGKAPRARAKTQSEINRMLVAEARAGKAVVRLKGGDPFVFGRGGEEAEALARAGIPFEIVPGVTSAVAGPAAAGIPLTHRTSSASVAIATAHAAPGGAGARIDWEALARADTVVLLMGVSQLERVAANLVKQGKDGGTPAAVIQDATLSSQKTVTATLSTIARAAQQAKIQAPAILIVGDVVSLRPIIGGWDTRPLSGRRVLVTRTREQASELSEVLRELGADVVEAPAISVREPRSWKRVDHAIDRVSERGYDWIVFTSANGVASFARRLHERGADARAFSGAKICAIGPGTAAALGRIGIVADLVPTTFTTRAIAEAFPRGRGRVLLARADVVEPGLDDALVARGWTVEGVAVYRIVGTTKMEQAVRRAILEGGIDVITFASGGTVRAFMKLLKAKPARATKIVCIGPVTARAAKEAGLRVSKVASHHTIPGLAAAVVDSVERSAR